MLKRLLKVSGASYFVALISFINSIIIIQTYGLQDRGDFVTDTLAITIISGMSAAIYESSIIYAQNQIKLLFKIYIAGAILVCISGIYYHESLQFIILSVVCFCSQTFIAGRIVKYLKSDLYSSIISRIATPFLFLMLNMINLNIDYITTSSLFFNHVLSNLICVLFCVKKPTGVFSDSNSNQENKNSAKLVFLSRPLFLNMDKLILSNFVTSSVLGAYVTITSIIGIGSPVLNLINQMSYIGAIKRVSNFKNITFYSLLLGCCFLPIIDHVFYSGTFIDYYYLSLVSFIWLFYLQYSKHLENEMLKLGNVQFMVFIKLILTLSILATYLFDLGLEAAFFVITINIYYLYRLINEHNTQQIS